MNKTFINIGKVENINPNVEKVEGTFITGEKKSAPLTFRMPLSPTEPRPDKPYDIIISMMGSKAHLATLKFGPTRISEDGEWYADVTILKGSALSNEFWEENKEKIKDYIANMMTGFEKHQ